MRINTRAKFVIFLVLWFGFVFLSTAMVVRMYRFMKNSSLWRINKVEFTGLKRISEAEVLKIMDIPQHVSVWDVNLSRLEAKLSNHPWIEKAVVKWRFPGVVSVTLVERYPVAVLCCDGCYYIDSNGRLFIKVDPKKLSHDDVPWFKFCPTSFSFGTEESFVLPEDVLSGFLSLIQALRNNFAASWKKAEISYSYSDGFIVNFEGIRVLIGTNAIANAVLRLQYIIQKMGMFDKSANIQEIDVRYARWAFIR